MLTFNIIHPEQNQSYPFTIEELLNEEKINPILINDIDFSFFCRSILLFSNSDQTMEISEENRFSLQSDFAHCEVYTEYMLMIAKYYYQDKYDQIDEELIDNANLKSKTRLLSKLPKLMYIVIRAVDDKCFYILTDAYDIYPLVLDMIITEFPDEFKQPIDPDLFINPDIPFILIKHKCQLDINCIIKYINTFYSTYLRKKHIEDVNRIGKIFYILNKSGYYNFNMNRNDKQTDILKLLDEQFNTIKENTLAELLFSENIDQYMENVFTGLILRLSDLDSILSPEFEFNITRSKDYKIKLDRTTSVYVYNICKHYINSMQSSYIPDTANYNFTDIPKIL